ncbi:MAG: 3D domain-containing protein [Candidatus Liptonbacteria bacterium]|nr:3D domain-containing protein [Candidatus Liptonbacteria bacterium]
MITKSILLILGLSSSLFPGTSGNTTTPAMLSPQALIGYEAPNYQVGQTLDLWVTAYSSTPEETDDTPFTTASGMKVRDGIVATNLLPFGTKVQIPEFFGDKVFTVEDRMHQRKTNNIDVWMPSKDQAKRFGITYTKILVLD